jgi:hypothetical protein
MIYTSSGIIGNNGKDIYKTTRAKKYNQSYTSRQTAYHRLYCNLSVSKFAYPFNQILDNDQTHSANQLRCLYRLHCKIV